MTPKTYLDRYTFFKVRDPITGALHDAPVTRYGSGWEDNDTGGRGDMGPACMTEMHNGLFAALAIAVFGRENRHQRLGPRFQPLGLSGTNFDPGEEFYKPHIKRAFLGKGSPDEISDTLRLALAVGRIGTADGIAGHRPAAPTVLAYVDRFISIDCNAFVGNFCGCNPSTAIGEYALPANKRSKVEDIKPNDLIISVNAEGRHAHIALVEAIQRGTDPKKPGACQLTLCEWGQGGPESNHYKTYPIVVKAGPKTQYGVGYEHKGKFRYFFSPPTEGAGPRGWGWGGQFSN